MSSNFQFAFLGPHNNYLASVTIIASNRPLQPSVVESYGLPESFTKRIKTQAIRKYFFNIRGHDFLSYTGQWTTSSGEGHVDACGNMYSENLKLQKIVIENSKKGRSSNMYVTYGPQPGSFFADAVGLNTYRRQRLPERLDDWILDLMSQSSCFSRGGYGKIHDVAINCNEGWILVLKRGKKYQWGGILPEELSAALEDGKLRKASISRVFLNHQSSNEYVLLFSDGLAYASLHAQFESILENILTQWAKDRDLTPKLRFNPTCYYSEDQQKSLNAAYYNQRGLFHLARNNVPLALLYLNEAHRLDPSSAEIHENLGMVLVATRQLVRDDELEQYLALPANRRPNQSVLKRGEMALVDFRMAYVGMEGTGRDMRELEGKLEVFRREVERKGKKAEEEWTYQMVVGDGNGNGKAAVFEFENVRNPAAELIAELPGSRLDGRVHSHEMVGDNGLQPP